VQREEAEDSVCEIDEWCIMQAWARPDLQGAAAIEPSSSKERELSGVATGDQVD
jgi:hypothetical protein